MCQLFFASHYFQIQPKALIPIVRIKTPILMAESDLKKWVKNKHEEHTRFIVVHHRCRILSSPSNALSLGPKVIPMRRHLGFYAKYLAHLLMHHC